MRGTALTILLVDDDPLMHRMMVPRLQQLEVEPRVADVRSAQTPEAALDALRAMPGGPIAVVSDYHLKASMTGLELLRQVRDERPDAIRILFSGYGSEEIGDVGGEGAAHAFLEKPLRLDELVAPIARVIQERLSSAG